jgi:DNA-binding MarR family transcriptional regulator
MEHKLRDSALLALRQIVRGIDLESKQLVQRHGITRPQALILAQLLNTADLTVGELAKRVNLSQATVTDILDRLEKRQLVNRTRSEADKRRVLVSATPGVAKIFQEAPALLETNFACAFKKLDPPEQRQIVESLKRVAALLGTDDIVAPATDTLDPKKDVMGAA